MVAEKDMTTIETLKQHWHAWGRAAHRTPHSTPIELRPEDFSDEAQKRIFLLILTYLNEFACQLLPEPRSVALIT